MEKKDDKEKEGVFVETYAGDIARAIENNRGGSIVKEIIHTEEELEKKEKKVSPEFKRNTFFALAGLAFLVFGFVALYYFFLQREEAPTVPAEPQFVSLIFNDKSSLIEVAGLDKERIVQAVAAVVRGTEVKKGAVEGIYPVYNGKAVGLREFLGLANISFVPDNNPLLVSDDFLMGVVNSGNAFGRVSGEAGKDFFMILKMRSISDIFSSLRAWEEKMPLELGEFFEFAVTPETQHLLAESFEDDIIENKNARVLYWRNGESNGKIAMIYIFANDRSVVITNTPSAASEIILRLTLSNKTKR